MSEIKIHPFGPSPILGEIYQAKDLKFQFLSKLGENEFKACHPPCKCRDFLHDIVHATQTSGEFYLYSMRYSGKETPIDLDVLRFLLIFPDKATFEIFQENLEELNRICSDAGFGPVEVTQIPNTLTLILETDPEWLTTAMMLSVFTFLCKLACYKPDADSTFLDTCIKSCEGHNQNSKYTELHYIKILGEKKLKKLLKNVKKTKIDTFHGWRGDEESFTHLLHDCSGFLTMCRRDSGILYPALAEYNTQYQKVKSIGL